MSARYPESSFTFPYVPWLVHGIQYDVSLHSEPLDNADKPRYVGVV